MGFLARCAFLMRVRAEAVSSREGLGPQPVLLARGCSLVPERANKVCHCVKFFFCQRVYIFLYILRNQFYSCLLM